MAKKEFVKITPEGLNLLTVLNFSCIADTGGFYNKEVFFSELFSGDTQYLFQSLGNIGAFARSKDLDSDVSYIIISNGILNEFELNRCHPFILELEDRLNRDSSPYRRIKLLSESQLIWHLEKRANSSSDELLLSLVKKYKNSTKGTSQQKIFDFET